MGYDASLDNSVEAAQPHLLESAWGLGAGTLIAAGKGIVDSLGSIGAAIGVTSPYEARNTRDVIAEYSGETAAQFYDRNPNVVEGAGLLVGTIIPGTAGIKVLRAAQAAKGSMLGSMLRLPHAALEGSRGAAVASMATSDSIYAAINANTAKALASGAAANVLDMAAFEVAAMSVTFASPVYSDFTTGDYAKSMITNIALGGAVGTAFSTAKTGFLIKNAAREADATTAPIRNLTKAGAAEQLPWVNLRGFLEELDDTAAVIAAKKLGATDPAVAVASTTRKAAIKNGVNTEAARLAGGDTDITTSFANMLLTPEVDAASIVNLATKIQRGGLEDASVAGRTFDTVTNKAFDAGMKPVTHIGDTLTSGHTPKISGDDLAIISVDKDFKLIKIGADFEQLDAITAQAAWLRTSLAKGIELKVAANDLPRMEKLLDASDELLKKSPAIIGGKVMRTYKEIETAVFEEKFRQAEALSTKMIPEEIAVRLNIAPAFLEEAKFSNMIAKHGEELSNFLRAPRNISVLYDLPKVTSAVDHLFTVPATANGEVLTAISSSSFLREIGREVKPITTAAITRKLEAGAKLSPPTITVLKDGTLSFDGNKRITAVNKLLRDSIVADTDHVPVRVIVTKDAPIPASLPDGSPFPVIRTADGKIVTNPAAQNLPVRLTRQFHEESMRVENMNREFSKERSITATSLHPDLAPLPEESIGLELLATTGSRAEGAQGFATNTESVTGGIGGFAQLVGVQANRLMKTVREGTANRLNQVLIAPMKDEKFTTGAELITLRNHLAGTEASYVLDRATGAAVREDIAINAKLAARKQELQAAWDAASASGALTPAQIKAFKTEMRSVSRVIPAGKGAESIPLSPEAFEVMATSTEINTNRLAIGTKVHATMGQPSLTLAQQYGMERIYMHPVNTKKLPHFVFVREADSITQTSHTSVMSAPTAEALASKVKLLQQEFPGVEVVGSPKSNYEFFYKKDIEAFHKAQGDYEYARGMNDNAIDSALRSKKMMFEKNPPIDKQHVKDFFDDMIDWHRRMDDKSVRDVVELKYAQLFRQLEIMGDSYTKAGTSVLGGNTASAASFAAQTVRNPYGDMIKQALDIGKQLEYPTWMAANEFMNKGWAKMSLSVRKVGLAMMEAKTPRDFAAEAGRLNAITEKMGVGNPYQAGMVEAFRDMLPLNPTLTANIAKGNALLNFAVLGSDMLQAFNTLIGTTVHATELVALRSKILAHNAAGAGKLAGLAAAEVPSSVEILAKATGRYFKGGEVWNAAKGAWEQQTGKELLNGYIRNGLRIGDAKALADAMDNFAYNPTIGAEVFGKKIDAGMEAIRKYTGNTPADAISRFMAADSMRQITDIAMSKGLISNEAEAAIYINQHVTRVHGASIASQRPIMFSGPIGQSIGVFMTFYTNFLQRMFQHTGAGDKGALATMAAMQVGLYGLQGLPAFNFINTHVIGTASGNKKHADIYTAIGGSEEAKWMMYGAGSNMLGLIHPDLAVNLYSRGDLNPRQASIIPIMPQDTALFTATQKTVSNLATLAQHLSGGAGIAPSLLFALEHNGVNRPLSGLGAFLSGGQSTTKGTLLAGYGDTDLASFAFLARIAGGKPLDDATAADALYRMQAYKADRASRIAAVGENMRVAMKDGGQPEVLPFMRDYTHAGGNLDHFNSFMKRQFVTANNSQINKAAEDLNSPEAEGLSRLLGGEPMQDLRHPQ